MAIGCGEPPPDNVAGRPCAPRGPALPWFREAAAASGVDFDFVAADFRGGAIAVADMDGDGLLDILAGSRSGGLALFRNRGDLSFGDDTAAAGLTRDGPAHFIAPGDLDNDGDRDLLIAGDRILLYENRGGARFAATGQDLGDGSATEHILLVDLDADGWLDAYVSNRDRRDPERSRNRLLRNPGGALALEEVPGAAGADSTGLSWTASAFDADGDGDVDLHVANDTLVADHGQPRPTGTMLPPDAFYRNDGEDGELRLTDIAGELGLDGPRSSMGGLVADFDGDQRLDLYITDFGRKKLFAGAEAGGFAERGEELGVAGTTRSDGICALAANRESKACLLLSWGSQLADLDLDGHDDLVVLNGVSVIDGLPPPALVLRGPPPFQEIDAGLGCFEGHGLIAADLDADDDLDLVASPRDGPLRLFENLAAGGRPGLSLALDGRQSNREGIGAVVSVRTSSGRRLVRVAGAGGVAQSSPPVLVHFGLGEDSAAEIEIRWPSGVRQELTAPEPGRRALIATEPAR